MGHAFEVINLLFEEKIINYYSNATGEEYYNVIAYPKIMKGIPQSLARERVDVVILYSERVSIKRSFKKSKTLLEKVRDPKDIPFLDVVCNSKAEFLITYDRKHLLRIRDKNKRFKIVGMGSTFSSQRNSWNFTKRERFNRERQTSPSSSAFYILSPHVQHFLRFR